MNVIYEDNHLLAIDKPAGLATMGSERGEATAARLAASYIKDKYRKPGNVFIGVVSRLDRLVSGVLLLARTSKAASRLSQQLRDREPEKSYLALVEGRLPKLSTACEGWYLLEDYLRKNESQQRMQVTHSRADGAQVAQLRCRAVAESSRETLLEIQLLTGRKHQIRVQLAQRDLPILGDRKYGSERQFGQGIALHCSRMLVKHPTGKQPISLEASATNHWKNSGFWKAIDPAVRRTLQRMENQDG
ncbi:MAG: RluA family pseudouridine synthase [Planctomycetales bacterium]|nr:RluA family pseudouridine synthase [Planctomycetales bacterium]